MLENPALRQELVVVKRRHPSPRLGLRDKMFWVALRRLWSDWKKCFYLVAPETLPRWHSAGFRLYWTILCKARKRVRGGKRISKEIRQLILQMVAENPTWGAPRIHGEPRMLGFSVSERTISLWMRRASRNPEPAKRRLHARGTRAEEGRRWVAGLPDLLLYASMIDDGILLLQDGALMATWRYAGPDLGSVTHEEMAALAERLNFCS